MNKLLIIVSLCISSALLAGGDASKLDIQAAKQLIDANYAPRDFKKDNLAWDLDSQSAAAIKKIEANKSLTIDASQKIFADFIHSMQDWHVSTMFYSSEVSFFPLSVQSAEGHYIFDKVLIQDGSFALFWELFGFDKTSTLTNVHISNFEKIQIGDELIAFNGMPISKAIDEIRQKNVGPNKSATAARITEKLLFFRSGMRGHECPKGKFSITVLHQGEKSPKKYEFNWMHIPNVVKNNLAKGIFKGDEIKSLFDVEKKFGRRLEVAAAKEALNPMKHIKKAVFELDEDEDEDDDFDDRKGFLPPLGEIEWTADDGLPPGYERFFWSYIYTNKMGKKVGYIHIPDFSPGDKEEIILGYLRWFKENLKILEERADAVVLDITNNPGGNAVYMYSMLSMLSNKPLSIPKHYEKLTQKDIFQAHIYLKLMELYPDDFDDSDVINDSSHIFDNKKLKAWLKNQVKAWDSGKRLTPLQDLLGISKIPPNPTFNLSLPIVVLVNEMDFSCGDFFPAILQDNKRAVIFGKTTAGAGGAVQFYPFSSATGVKGISLTSTLAIRSNGQPIENKGVTPDVPYEPTVRDLRENWADYIEAVNETIDSLLK